MFESILYECKDEILYLTLNQPETYNALTPSMWEELGIALQKAGTDQNVRVIILTGAGDKAFASGADIRELHERDYLKVLHSKAGEVLSLLGHLQKPVICAINGYALGGGCELAMACDIRIATRRSRFGQPELGIGILPGAGGTQRLVALVGMAKAKELIFTGKVIDANEAKSIGLLNQVTLDDAEALLDEAEKMAKQMISKAPVALELAKLSINAAAEANLETGLLIERLSETIAFSTEDRYEGTAAFLEKRKPSFKGR